MRRIKRKRNTICHTRAEVARSRDMEKCAKLPNWQAREESYFAGVAAVWRSSSQASPSLYRYRSSTDRNQLSIIILAWRFEVDIGRFHGRPCLQKLRKGRIICIDLRNFEDCSMLFPACTFVFFCCASGLNGLCLSPHEQRFFQLSSARKQFAFAS